MTYSAPSVTNLLDDVSLAKVNEGYYDGKVVNVVDPNDSVGAGGIVEYDRHVGSTFTEARISIRLMLCIRTGSISIN